jgi:hypothetical protein
MSPWLAILDIVSQDICYYCAKIRRYPIAFDMSCPVSKRSARFALHFSAIAGKEIGDIIVFGFPILWQFQTWSGLRPKSYEECAWAE